MKLFIFALITLQIISCSTPRPEGKTEAEVLFREAKRLIDNERFLLATEKLNQIRAQHPYSYYATHAELLSADVLYSQENYAEAAAAYIVFRDFHPKYKNTEYVIFRIGESFYKQLPDTFDRDLTTGTESIKYFKELTRLFPNSRYVGGAVEKIKKIKDLMWKKDKYIADFYYKTGVYDSARYRYLKILNEYSIDKLENHSMIRVLMTTAKLEEKDKCAQYYESYKTQISQDRLGDLKSAFSACKN